MMTVSPPAAVLCATLRRPLARFDRSIDVHVCSIRQKLPLRPDKQSWVQTVRGMGYLFLPE